MFSQLFTLAVVATAVVAAPAPWDSGSGSSTGTPLCCQDVQNSSDPGVASLIKSLIGVDVSGLNVPVGTGCSGIAVAGGVECNQNPVTCGSTYSYPLGLVGIDCVPIVANA